MAAARASSRAARRDAHSLAGLVPRRALHLFQLLLSRMRTESRPQIYRVAAEGGPVEPVVPTARRAVFAFPTPDGKGFDLLGKSPDGVDLALWWRPFDRSELNAAHDRHRRVRGSVDDRGRPDPDQLAGTVSPGADPLFDSQGAPRRRPSRVVRPATSIRCSSPTALGCVFTSSRSGFQNLWTSGPDGTMARALTSGNAFDEQPAILPDGTAPRFVSDRGGQSKHLVMTQTAAYLSVLVRPMSSMTRLVKRRGGSCSR